MPSRTSHDHMTGKSNLSEAFTSERPMPFVVPYSSAITISSSERDRLSRSPAKIFGAAVGSTTMAIQYGFGVRNDLAVSVLTWSTERTPSMVLSNTGQIAPKRIEAVRIPVVSPNSVANTGDSVGGGSARKNANSGPK